MNSTLDLVSLAIAEPGLRPRRGVTEPEDSYKRRWPVGAEALRGGKGHFRVWAPKRQRMEVVFKVTEHDAFDEGVELQSEGNGYFSAIVEGATPPMLYGLRGDGVAAHFASH